MMAMKCRSLHTSGELGAADGFKSWHVWFFNKRDLTDANLEDTGMTGLASVWMIARQSPI